MTQQSPVDGHVHQQVVDRAHGSDASQVERVVFAAEYGSIWLALEQEDSNEEGTDIITRGNVYR